MIKIAGKGCNMYHHSAFVYYNPYNIKIPVPRLFGWLIYNNPFNQKVELCWYKNFAIYYLDLGLVSVEASKVTTVNVYRFITGFDDSGNPIFVQGQHNILQNVPGDPLYNPLWRVMLVEAPPGYMPDSIRSDDEIRRQGLNIIPTEIVINCPVL